MSRPLALFIGLRYTRAKKRNYFVSFISLSSMLGIGLGVMVLITVLSVMNGFDLEIHKRFFGMVPEVTISGMQGKMSNWSTLQQELRNFSEVTAIAPFVAGQGLLTHEGQVIPVILTGIDPIEEQSVINLKEKLLAGDIADLKNFGIMLGRTIADTLGVLIGDKVTIMIPQATSTPAGIIPRFKRFTVIGVFSAGSGFNFDSKLAFINLTDAQKLMQWDSGVITGLKMKLGNIYHAPAISEQLTAKFGKNYAISNWTQEYGAFFKAIKMEKNMMFLILLLIIAVAAFNLIASLVMVVNDKEAEIAILRTIGATPFKILCIFIIQGMMVGLMGVMIGLVGGILLASNATIIVNKLQSFFHTQILASNIYFVDYLPSKILISDIGEICCIALLMSFLATIYPAWRASKITITKALHYE